jgi:hypothetical protein
MPPFVEQLSASLADTNPESHFQNLGSIKMISPAVGFPCHAGKERPDRRHRVTLPLEPDKLGMTTVSLGQTGQDLLREECLPPCRNEPF